MFEGDRIITLDVGASKVVLAEFSTAKGSGLQLLNYGIGDLGVAPEGETDNSAYIVTVIRELMRDRNIRRAPLIMSISGQSVFPRYVKLPPVTQDKIQQIISYEAEQNVPFPIDEVVWDHQLLGDDAGDMNVMIVAVKTENVSRLTDCVQAAGLEPDIVDVAPMALYNAVRFNYPDVEGCVMVLDIGARSSNLVFIEDKRILCRSIPVAGNTITQEIAKDFDVSFDEAEDLKRSHAFVAFGGVYAGPENEVADRVSKIVRNVITRLHAEVNRSINFYRSQQHGSAPSLVLLTGGSSVIPHTDTFFREKLNVEVDFLNPFINVAVSDALGAEGPTRDLHLLGEVVGLALRRGLACPIEVNLMPPDLVAKKTFRRRQPFFALAAVGLVLTMLSWFVYFHRMGAVLENRMARVTQRTTDLRDISDQIDSVLVEKRNAEATAARIAEVIGRRTELVAMIDAIHGCLLDGMWLTSLKPVVFEGKVTHIEISGKGFVEKLVDTSESTAIERFRDRLQDLSEFKDGNEDTKIVHQPTVKSGDLAREFTLRAALERPLDRR